jgi:hypothetical protein
MILTFAQVEYKGLFGVHEGMGMVFGLPSLGSNNKGCPIPYRLVGLLALRFDRIEYIQSKIPFFITGALAQWKSAILSMGWSGSNLSCVFDISQICQCICRICCGSNVQQHIRNYHM